MPTSESARYVSGDVIFAGQAALGRKRAEYTLCGRLDAGVCELADSLRESALRPR
jgi:hypothetical protein